MIKLSVSLAFTLLVSLPTSASFGPFPGASLVWYNGLSAFKAKVISTRDDNPELMIDCIWKCSKLIHYVDDLGRVPLGLAMIGDGDPGVLGAVWGGGSAYSFTAYRIGRTGVEKIAELGSWYVPFFGVNNRGRFVTVFIGEDRFQAKWITYYLTDRGLVRVSGFVKQR